MNCPKCDADIGDSYEDRSVGSCGGWYCDACEFAIREHEVLREPMAANVEIMSAREFLGDRPPGTPLSELSTQEVLISPDSASADDAIAKPSEAVLPAVPPHERSEAGFTWNDPSTVAPRRPKLYLAPVLLTIAALALSAVGIAINGWFARSLGSTPATEWMFLAVGVTADLVALVVPSIAAGLWQARQRATAMVGWAVWLLAFVFAMTASVGFASMNIIDVGLARASRVTPAVTSAQAALSDAMGARDRECKVVGKFCREREAAVAEQRRLLDAAMTRVGQAADPQTDAAIKLVAWGSLGMLRPEPEDFAMLRLLLLALLPQIGGMLLLIRRRSAGSVAG